MNSFSVSQIHYILTSRIYQEFTFWFANSISRIYQEFTIRELTMPNVLALPNKIFKIGQFWTQSFIKRSNEFRVKAYNRIKQPDLTLFCFTQVWPLMIFDDLIWPQIILKINFRKNSESKHIYSTGPIWCLLRIWPLFDLWWLFVTWSNNFNFKISKK